MVMGIKILFLNVFFFFYGNDEHNCFLCLGLKEHSFILETGLLWVRFDFCTQVFLT